MNELICPFCLTIFLYTNNPGDDCPDCGIGVLEDLWEYYQRIAELDNDKQDKDS